MNNTNLQLHVVFVLLSYKDCTIDEFFNYGICQINQAESLAKQNIKVTVISRFSKDEKKSRNGVVYYFVKDGKPTVLKKWQNSKKVLHLIFKQKPDIIHLHGFIFPRFLYHLIKKNNQKSKIVAEYHSEPVFKRFRWLITLIFNQIDQLIFTNYEAAEDWSRTFSFPKDKWSFSIECAPDSKFMQRKQARKISGFSGAPIFLWNSRLVARRDPLTVIQGFEDFLKQETYPNSHFYMMTPDYDEELMKKLETKIASNKYLSKAVTIIKDRKPHNSIAPYFNSADYIISGSLVDGYGYGVADAMSCGLIPIVTNISTFKQITNNGKLGGIWEAKKANSLTDVLIKTVNRTFPSISNEALRVSQHFEKHLNKEAQAEGLIKIYRDLFK